MNKKDRDFWSKVFRRQAKEIDRNLQSKNCKTRIDPYIRKEVGPITKRDFYILRLRLIFINTIDQFIQFVEDSNG